MTPSSRRRAKPAFPWLLVALVAGVVGIVWWVGREPSSVSRPFPAAQAGHPTASAPRPDVHRATGTRARRTSPRVAAASPVAPPQSAPSSAREDRAPAETGWQPARPLLPSGSGRVAIIVDDVGYNADEMKDFAALDYPLTFSILPGVPGSRELARECAASGFEVMLHLPMEPLNSRLNPGPGCIMVDMTDEQIAALVEEHLADAPQAAGVNNHMGSRATADARVMRAVLSVLRRRGLFFVDSLTTGSSVAQQVAAELGVPYAARSVFLDTNFAPEAGDAAEFFDSAQERMRQLGGLAQHRGAAIGICHYHSQTARMLSYLLPELKRAGVEVVSVSQLVGSARPTPPTAPRGPERTPRSYEPAEAR